MNRSLLTPRWLLLHLVFVAAVIATGALAWWQWSRAQDAGGSFQNLGYALQWPLFGAFTLFLWFRMAQMTVREQREATEPERAASETDPAAAPQDAETARKRPLVPPPAPPVDAEEDPELAEYNRYLAELNESRQQS